MKNLIGFGLFAVLLAESLPAYAQSPASLGGAGQSKVSSSQQRITVKERTDNEVERKKKQGKSEREKREEKGGGLSRSDFETAAIEKDLSKALENEIRYMEPLVAKLPSSSEKRPEIMRRLIESLHQLSLLEFFKESRQYDEAWNKWDQGGRRGTEPRFSMTRSKISTSKVIQRCQQFIAEYPKAKGIDEVTFQLAYAFDQLNQQKQAAQYYSRLVALYPNSKRVADAHFALGEYHFGRFDWPKALTSFSEVVRYTRAPIRPWAEFKIAWCLYNQQKYQQALERWQLVVSLAGTSNTTSKGARLKMKDEALRDMLLAYVELGQVDQAVSYISSNASEKSMGDLFNKLSSLLQDKGQYDQSVMVLKTYISMKPNDFRAADLQVQIVDTADLKLDKSLLWQEIDSLNKKYGPDSNWAKVNANNPEFKEIQEKIHNVSYTYAKKMHYLGQQEKNQKYFLEQAIKGYKIYLATFPNRKETTEIRFLLGELQYLRDQYRDAGKTFAFFTSKKELRTADPQRFEKAFDYQRTAAYFLIQKDVAALRAIRFSPGQPTRALTPDMQEYINVCDSYASVFPKKQGTLDCQVDTAEIFLKTNNTAQAEKRLMVLAKERAGQKEGAAAAEFLLLLSKDDKKKLISTTDTLIQIPQYRGSELGKRLSEIKRANRFDELKELESGGKFDQAAQEFERLAADKTYTKADAALFNAGVNYKRANRLDKATAAYQRLITDYPKSDLVDDAMLEIIDLSSGRLQLQMAVSYARMYLSKFPNSPKAPKLMAGACAYYEALSQAERAREICPQVMKGGGPAASLAAESMAGVLERSGRYQEFWNFAEKDLLRFSKTTSDKIEVWNRIVEAARKAGNSSKAATAQQQIVKLYESDKKSVVGSALSYVGAIRFAQEFPSVDKFRREVITGGKSGAEFEQNIKRRNAELKKLTDKFLSIAQNVGDAEWSVASLYVVGYAHELVASELLNPPQPPGISGDGWQKVKATLATLGVGLQKKAKDYYQEGGVIISKFNIYTDYGQKVLSALARLEPTKYRKSEESIPTVIFVGTEVIDSAKYKSVLEAKGF
jgi:TolA-binding protein